MGALFFTVLMVAGFSVLSLALDAQTDIVTTQRMVSDIEIKKQQEQFGILVFTDGDALLNINVNNLGQNPVEISSIWITNKTLPDQPATRYDVNYDDAFVPSGFTNNVISTQMLEMIPDTYDIKVISAIGTIKTVEFVVGVSSSGLRAELLADPPDVIIGQNVTIAMIVTNTGDGLIQDVQPEMQPLEGSGSEIASTPHTPTSVNLNSGESVMFTWDYQVTGNIDDDIIFSARARGDSILPDDVSSNNVTDTIILREDATGTTEPPIVLTQDLLSRPEIFLTFPSPMGDGDTSADKGLWGANIVNPTSQDMVVSKVVISLISPRSVINDIMFSASGGSDLCNPVETVAPTSDDWSCPEHNQLVWKGNPVTIPPYSSFPFNARVNPDRLSQQGDTLSSVIVHANVYTTVGQFGKAGYGSSFDNNGDGQSIPNVYLSDVVDSIDSNDMLSSKTGILSGSLTTFNVVLADLEANPSNKIDDSSRLIINIPKGWVVNEPSIDGHGDFTTSYQSFIDTSSQIIGELNADLGSGGVTITFDATAPTVTTEQMYVMYLLADGSTDNGTPSEDFGIGPLQEAILQVIPS